VACAYRPSAEVAAGFKPVEQGREKGSSCSYQLSCEWPDVHVHSRRRGAEPPPPGDSAPVDPPSGAASASAGAVEQWSTHTSCVN